MVDDESSGSATQVQDSSEHVAVSGEEMFVPFSNVISSTLFALGLRNSTSERLFLKVGATSSEEKEERQQHFKNVIET